MLNEYIEIASSGPLHGEAFLEGAKNAVLVILASLVLTSGKSRLFNVPCNEDVFSMIKLLNYLGAETFFDFHNNILEVDTSSIYSRALDSSLVHKIRASILFMGPLLARFEQVKIGLPGGDAIGARPIDFHLKALMKMGIIVEQENTLVKAYGLLRSTRLVLEYPSVGATENILMAAVLTLGTTEIVNAALEPEVMDLIFVLKKMGADIAIMPPAQIIVKGVNKLNAIEHEIMPDRLEAGSLLLAAAITGGTITINKAQAYAMDVFLLKLEEMGHTVIIGEHGVGISLIATKSPCAVSFRTAPYPGFPTDLQAPMMATLCLANGVSEIQETVYENRFMHAFELQKMGAKISISGNYAVVCGVESLKGQVLHASDIRASCALVLAGLIAQGKTYINGLYHLQRGYHNFDKKLIKLGARITVNSFTESTDNKLAQNSCG